MTGRLVPVLAGLALLVLALLAARYAKRRG